MTDQELKGRNAYIYVTVLTMFGKSIEETREVAIDQHGLNDDDIKMLDEYIDETRQLEGDNQND